MHLAFVHDGENPFTSPELLLAVGQNRQKHWFPTYLRYRLGQHTRIQVKTSYKAALYMHDTEDSMLKLRT
jgi:hypothetical protein